MSNKSEHDLNSRTNGGDGMIPHFAKLTSIKPESPGIHTYGIEFLDPGIGKAYHFLPGQFNMLYVPGIGEVAISISSDPNQPKALLHTIRIAGNVTQAIDRLRVDGTLGVRGPYGSSWPVEASEGKDIIFVGGGIGLAPLRPAIYHVIQNRKGYGKVTILIGARNSGELLFLDEYDSWSQHDIEVIPTVDRGDKSWDGRVGVVPMLFYSLRPDARRTIVFTCGPEIMMRFVVYEALARRIPEASIYVSLERNMKCGIGLCGHCQYGPTFLCKEGPVLSYDKVAPFFSVEDF
jgi:NAD(P)H-flavin reductase